MKYRLERCAHSVGEDYGVRYRYSIYSTDTPTVIADVYGETIEAALANAEDIVRLLNGWTRPLDGGE